MSDDVTWRPLDVVSAEGMTLRVGAFRASDGEVVEFTPAVLRKVFEKVTTPIPMYLTHAGATGGVERPVLGHAVKLGLQNNGDQILYKALMMDPTFKEAYLAGADDTSAEITPIRDKETHEIIDGTLTGIAVVPNPAISGTDMTIRQVMFSAHVEPTAVVEKPKDAIKLTGSKLEKTLLESGVPADKVAGLMESLTEQFSKQFEHDGLAKKFEDAQVQLGKACDNEKTLKKNFEDLQVKYDGLLKTQVDTMVGEVKKIGFAAPEKVIEGLPADMQITMLSKIKDNMLAATPPAAPSVGLKAPSGQPGDAKAQFATNLQELGLEGMWNTLKTTPVKEA